MDANRGSRSEMIRLEVPNHGTRCFRYSCATPDPSIVLQHGMNLATLEHPWSTIVSIESYLSDLGRSVIRSMDTYWKGPSVGCVSKCCRVALVRGMFALDSWHFAHPLTYSSTNCLSLGPLYCCLTRSHVFAIPGCPPVGASWISRSICCHSSMSSLRKIF